MEYFYRKVMRNICKASLRILRETCKSLRRWNWNLSLVAAITNYYSREKKMPREMHEREPIVRQRARQRASTARIRTAGESVGRGGEEEEKGGKKKMGKKSRRKMTWYIVWWDERCGSRKGVGNVNVSQPCPYGGAKLPFLGYHRVALWSVRFQAAP